MAKTPKMWIYRPPKPAAPKVPDRVKLEVQERADRLIETILKPQHVQPPPKGYDFNYIVDLYAKWYRHYFNFCAKYSSPGPNALSPFFEVRFARMEYVGANHFDLAYMRHTGQWIMIYPDLSLDECLTTIERDPAFVP
jgi:hypothetical protein